MPVPSGIAVVAKDGCTRRSDACADLMTDRSGIRHYRKPEFPGTPGDENVKPIASFAETVAMFMDDPLLYRSGEFSSYSSFAVNLLQGVIESASGVGLEEYMRDHVWGPAGMTRTAFDVPDRIVRHRARSYRMVDGSFANTPYGDITYKFASDGMISTVTDLVRFGAALNGGKLLRKETVDIMYDARLEPVPMFEPNRAQRRIDMRRALMWTVTTKEGQTVASHDGSVKGFGACLINDVEQDLTAAFMANSAGTSTCLSAQRLIDVFRK